MKFLVIHQDPLDYAADLYERDPELAGRSYDHQIIARAESLYGVGGSCSNSLRRLGHDAADIYATLTPLQQAWAQENNVSYDRRDVIRRYDRRFGIIPWPRLEENQNWIGEILTAQIKAYRPDVLYSFSLQFLNSEILKSVRDCYKFAIGHQVSGFPVGDVSAYDLVLTVQEDQANFLRSHGLRSGVVHLAYDARVEKYLENRQKRYDISYIGDLADPNSSSMRLLYTLCKKYNVAVWGRGVEKYPAGSPIRAASRGPIWGVDRYQVMRDSRIVLCSRSEPTREEAYESLLFQATGIGALALADADICPEGLFTPGKEVLTYRSRENCLMLVDYYLNRPEERDAIARAGQRRTFHEHNYYSRMEELADFAVRLQMGYEPLSSGGALASK